jgi:hypothetical protein
MGMFDPLMEQWKVVRQLTPARMRAMANEQLGELLEKEAQRARPHVDTLTRRYPTAGPRELSQHCVDTKKNVASVVGAVTGVFGVVTVPVDLAGMVYLQLALLTEVATVYKVSLRHERERTELLDLFGYANGIGPVTRASPRVLGSLAGMLLARGGLKGLSRAMPLVAAPISAYLNNQHIQQVGDIAVRHYDGWGRAHEKARRASGE